MALARLSPCAVCSTNRQHGGRAAAVALFFFLVHANAALLRHGRRVDAVHILRALQQSGNRRVAHQLGLGLGQRAAVDE